MIAERVVSVLATAQIVTLRTSPGAGKSTLLRHLQQQLDAGLIDMRDFYLASQGGDPLAMEDAFMQLCLEELGNHSSLLIDDFELFVALTQGPAYPRSGYLDTVCETLLAYVLSDDKQLLIVHEAPYLPQPLWRRAFRLEMPAFAAADYAFFGQRFLPASLAAGLNYDQIYRFAAHLNVHDLKRMCLHAAQVPKLDTDGFVALLREQQLASNVDLDEVQPVELGDLCGLDELLDSLMAGVIVPMEHGELAQALQLRPKRGVLLAGPPGTGKTTIGRALAHRLKGKFFLIDGTAIAESMDFHYKLAHTFRAAAENAPAVVFIDDSDVIFESGRASGFYRFLLTQLDGLHSKSASQVCVVMTAMNVASLPPALVRSGRIELWLETQLPDGMARMQMLYQNMREPARGDHHVGSDPLDQSNRRDDRG